MERKELIEIPYNDLKLYYIKTETAEHFAITKIPVNDIWWNIEKNWQLMKNTAGEYDRAGDIKDGTKMKAILWLKMMFQTKPSYMTYKLGDLEQRLKDLLNKHYNMMGEFSYREIQQEIPTPQPSGATETPTQQITNAVSIDMTETNELLKRMVNNYKEHDEFREETIKAIAEKIMTAKTEKIAEDIYNLTEEKVKKRYGELPEIKSFLLPDEVEKTVTGTFHKELDNIMRLIQLDVPIMLTGPAGSGKNFTLEKATEILGMDFYFTNAVTEEFKLTGFIDANGKYQETQFYKAFKDGGVFFLDEMDASIPEALIILNAAIANRYYDFPIGRVKAHKDFRVVAAANTYGTGADMVYVGRNVLDGATLDRFVVIPFDYDSNVEKSLCPNEELYRFCTELRRGINEKHLRYIISPRAMISSYKLSTDVFKETDAPRFTKEYIIKVAIIKGMTKDDLTDVKDYISNSPWKTALINIINNM